LSAWFIRFSQRQWGISGCPADERTMHDRLIRVTASLALLQQNSKPNILATRFGQAHPRAGLSEPARISPTGQLWISQEEWSKYGASGGRSLVVTSASSRHVNFISAAEAQIHRPTCPIASVGYPEAGESLIRRIAQRRLLASFHNQCLSQLVHRV
jgi:hypothetical protein